MANEIRLIDANALPYENQVLSQDDEWCLKVSDIDAAPTIDPESLRPKGRWECIEDQCNENPVYKCSECGQEVTSSDGTNIEKTAKYCINCGAKMEG